MDNMIAVKNKVRSICLEECLKLDEERLRADLMELYSDIASELKSNAFGDEKQIYEYSALLQDELELYSPYDAYEAGAILGFGYRNLDIDKDRAFMRFISRIEAKPDSKHIHDKVQDSYDKLHVMLGDASELLDDFTELYRKCNGIIQYKIDSFFDMGFTLSDTYSDEE